jgi:predicted Zn-dependent protease
LFLSNFINFTILYFQDMKLTFFFLLILAGSCAIVPFTGRKQFVAIPSSQIVALSADSYSQVLKDNKLSQNQKYVTQVKNVGYRLTAAVDKYMKENGMEANIKDYSWQYNVLVSQEMNAWCMPGGQIAFYEGIMPVCEDENGIAVVMGHEIAHAIAQHGNERMSQQLAIQMGGVALSEAIKTQKETTQQIALLAFGVGSQVGVELPFSRTHESEADEMGLYFMAMAGFDPRTAPVFWERMKALGSARMPEFLSTHPDPANRIKDINKHMAKALTYYQGTRK